MIGLDVSELIEAIWYVRSRWTPCFTEQYPSLPLVLQQIVPAFYRVNEHEPYEHRCRNSIQRELAIYSAQR
jgi:hypothetical protein